MSTTEIKAIPSISEVRAALAAAEAGWTSIILLRQQEAVNVACVDRFVQQNPGTRLPELAQELTRVRKEFNEIVDSCSKAAQRRAMELTQALLQELFGQAIPGPVTLPLESGSATRTFIVRSLSRINEDHGCIEGSVNVTDASGQCAWTERFYVSKGRACFAMPDIY